MRLRLFYFLLMASGAPAYALRPYEGTATGRQLNQRDLYFNRAREFPNLMLPERYRGKPLSVIPPKELAAIRLEIEAAATSMLRRMTVPLKDPKTRKPKPEYFFERMHQEARQIDAAAEVVPSAGVLRALYGTIYYEIHRAIRAEPDRDPDMVRAEVLKRLADDPEAIPGYRIRGVGSDFDILVKASTQEKFEDVKSRVVNLVEEVEQAYEMRSADIDDGFKRSLITIADVKPLETIGPHQGQIARSTKGGGSSLDLLYFNFDFDEQGKIKGGRFREPPELPGLVNKIICGKYPYLKGVPEDAEKQTIRGIRALFETPHLEIENQEQLIAELEDVIQGVKRRQVERDELLARYGAQKSKNPDTPAPTLPPLLKNKSLDQFAKMVRNARYGMANNRIWRAGPEARVEGLVRELVILLGRQNADKGGQMPLVPPYADSFPLPRQGLRPAEAQLPAGALMSNDEFRGKYLTEGRLYHGTPSLNAALAILRGGFRETFYESGFRRGPYSSPSSAVSQGYTGAQGVVLPLDLVDRQFRILDLRKLDQAARATITDEASRIGIEEADLLARKYGVDFIVLNDHEVLPKNVEAFKALGMRDLVNAYQSTSENPELRLSQRTNALLNHSRLYRLATDLGEKELKRPESAGKFFYKVKDPRPEDLPGMPQLELDLNLREDRELLQKLQKRNALAPAEIETLPEDERPARYQGLRYFSQLEQNLAQNRAAMDAYRRHDLAGWSGTVSRNMSHFPWDLRRTEDLAFLKFTAKRQGAALTDLLQKIEAFRATLAPGDAKRLSFSPGDFSLYSPDLADAAQQKRYLELSAEVSGLQDFQRSLVKVFRQTPREFLKHFPQLVPAVALSSVPRKPAPGFFADLFKKIGKGSRTPLDADERKLLDHFVRARNVTVLSTMLEGAASYRREALETIKRQGLFTEFANDASEPVRKILLRELASDPAYRGRAARAAAKGFHLAYAPDLEAFPWDLSRKEDREILRSYLLPASDLRNLTARRKRLAEKTKDQDFLKLTNQSNYKVPNEDKAVYISDGNRVSTHLQVLQVLGTQFNNNPKLVARHFSGLFPAIAQAAKDRPSDWYAESFKVAQKWKERGKGALTKAELAFVEKLEKAPLEIALHPFLDQGGAPRKWAIDRLLNFGKKDSAQQFLYLLEYSVGAKDLEKDLRYPKVKAALRDRVRKANFDLPGLERIPWDLKDPEDLKLWRELRVETPDHYQAMSVKLGELMEKYPRQYGWMGYGSVGTSPEPRHVEEFLQGRSTREIRDRSLKRDIERIRSDYSRQQIFERVAKDWLRRQPKVYLERFPDIRARAFSDLDLSFSEKGRRITTASRRTDEEARDLGDYAKLMESFAKKIDKRSRAPLTEEDRHFARQLLDLQIANATTVLLSNESRLKEMAFAHLKSLGDRGEGLLLSHFRDFDTSQGSQRGADREAALTLLNQDPSFKRKLLERALHDWRSISSMLDLKSPNDRAFLQEALRRYPETEAEYSARAEKLEIELRKIYPRQVRSNELSNLFHYIANGLSDESLEEHIRSGGFSKSAALLRDLSRRRSALTTLDRSLQALFYQDPDQSLELLPEVARRMSATGTSVYLAGRKDAEFSFGQGRLFERMKDIQLKLKASPGRLSLSQRDLKLFGHFLNEGDPAALLVAVTGPPELRKQAAEAFRKLGPERVATVFYELQNDRRLVYSDYSRNEYYIALSATLRSDRRLRGGVRSALIAKAWGTDPFEAFPWDLNDAQDAAILREAGRDLAGKTARYQKVIDEVNRRYKTQLTVDTAWYLFRSDANNIPDAGLRARFIQGRQLYLMAREGVPKILKRLGSNVAELEERKLPLSVARDCLAIRAFAK